MFGEGSGFDAISCPNPDKAPLAPARAPAARERGRGWDGREALECARPSAHPGVFGNEPVSASTRLFGQPRLALVAAACLCCSCHQGRRSRVRERGRAGRAWCSSMTASWSQRGYSRTQVPAATRPARPRRWRALAREHQSSTSCCAEGLGSGSSTGLYVAGARATRRGHQEYAIISHMQQSTRAHNPAKAAGSSDGAGLLRPLPRTASQTCSAPAAPRRTARLHVALRRIARLLVPPEVEHPGDIVDCDGRLGDVGRDDDLAHACAGRHAWSRAGQR